MRWLPIAVVVSLVIVPATIQAQRGGRGGTSGRSSAGFSRGNSGFAGRGVSPGSRGGFTSGHVRTGGSFVPAHRTFVGGRPAGFRRANDFDRFHGFNRFNRFNRFPRPFVFSGGCVHGPFFSGFPCRRFLFSGSFVWGYAPFYADYSYDPNYYSEETYAQPQPAAVESNNDSELAYEVGRLSSEVDYLREEEIQHRTEAQPPAAQSRESAAESSTNATLVFRDGKSLAVQNYAIVGQTVWVLNSRTARKIPIADLDLAATRKVNDDNGVEFHFSDTTGNP
jgi:hypothetical protein